MANITKLKTCSSPAFSQAIEDRIEAERTRLWQVDGILDLVTRTLDENPDALAVWNAAHAMREILATAIKNLDPHNLAALESAGGDAA